MALPASIACPKCRVALQPGTIGAAGSATCLHCHSDLLIQTFPALGRASTAILPGQLSAEEGEASCFQHPRKKAVRHCEGCGRFVCALCDVEIRGEHLCPSCIQAGKKKGKLKQLENTRVLYDDMAVSVAVLPLLLFYFTIFTAPAALFIAIRHWNTPSSVIPRSKYRFVVAIVFALLEIAGWLIFAAYLFHSLRNE